MRAGSAIRERRSTRPAASRSRSSESRPERTASTTLAWTHSGRRSWPRHSRSAPASRARTAPSFSPTEPLTARISRASVTTTPSKPSSPRRRSVITARLRVPGASSSPVTRMWAVITARTPALDGRAKRQQHRGHRLVVALDGRELEVRVLLGVAVAREVLRAARRLRRSGARPRMPRRGGRRAPGSLPNERTPTIGLSGFVFTSATGSEIEVHAGGGELGADRTSPRDV